MDTQVAVTGIGLVSALGNELEASFRALVDGTTAVTPLSAEVSGCSGISTAGLVTDFDEAAVVGRKNVKRSSRYLSFALLAARRAREDAGLSSAGYAASRVGSIFGSALGGLGQVADTYLSFQRSGLHGVSPFTLPASITNMAPGVAAIEAEAKGPCYSISAGWASSAQAISDAYETVRSGRADVMIAGGAEAGFSPFVFSVLARSGQFARGLPAEQAVQRPFDRGRAGSVASEGAAVLILENLDHARRRGANIYALFRGAAVTYASPRRPETQQSAMTGAMRNAMTDAQLDVTQVDYINAYGSALEQTDRRETAAVKDVFGEHARSLSLSSNKGAIGHMLGASAAFEAAMTILTLKHGVAPPTANLSEPDAVCDLDFIPGAAREQRFDVAMSNTFSETGHNVSLIFRAHA